jgi:hypothetical protein
MHFVPGKRPLRDQYPFCRDARRPLVIANGNLITGDGQTFIEHVSVKIEGGRIVDIGSGTTTESEGTWLVNADGATILPGIINAHAHGCVGGPSMPSGSLPFTADEVAYQRNRHLADGTTTLLNVCGLSTPEETLGSVGDCPISINVSTAHTPSNIAAAKAIDGRGLSRRHLDVGVEGMVEAGAVALGEAGGGQTLGGGAQDYRFIPQAIERATGVSIHPAQARTLKELILGRKLDGSDALEDKDVELHMTITGISGHLTVAELRRLITRTVMPPVALSLKGLREIAEWSQRLDMPAVFHSALPTAKTLINLAETFPRAQIIAGHSNHPSFLTQEAVDLARQLKDRGGIIDVSTLDTITTRWRNHPDNLDVLVEGGLVDTISTDYAGGDWDGILAALQRMVRKGQLTPVKATALATGNVARAFPQMAGDRGVIEKGRRADLLIVESHNLSRVRHIFIGGNPVVWNGEKIPNVMRS